MRSPLVFRGSHEREVQREVIEALSAGRLDGQREAAEALRSDNGAEIADLALRVPGFLVPLDTSGDKRADQAAARRRFREPIERVEAFASDRFTSVARAVGVNEKSAKSWHDRWSSYFNFHPYSNVNTTNPIPVASTAAGKLAIELGTGWTLTSSKHRRHKSSETAFFARVVHATEGVDEPAEIGFVRLGRIFSIVDLEEDTRNRGRYGLDYGLNPDTSGYPGRVVLGSKVEREKDFISSDPSAQAETLTRVERAASAFAVLSECAAVQAGVETHPVDANALSLALSTVQGLNGSGNRNDSPK